MSSIGSQIARALNELTAAWSSAEEAAAGELIDRMVPNETHALPVKSKPIAAFKLTGEKLAKPPKADECFDAVCGVCGLALMELTTSARGQLNKALSEIRTATPNVTPQEIRRRALAYAKEYPAVAKLAPSTLARCWPRYSPKNATVSEMGSQTPVELHFEPTGWQTAVIAAYPGESWADSAVKLGWRAMPQNWRHKIAREFNDKAASKQSNA